MSSDIPLPTPDPQVEESWFQRPAVLATCALVIVLIGTILWFVSRESGAASDTTVLAPFLSESSPSGSEGTTTDVGASGTTAASGPGTTATPVNPFGDVIGAPVAEPQSQAGRFAVAVDRRTDPSAVAALHSDAYYYALWAQLRSQQSGPGDGAVATASGYSVDVSGATVELVDLRPANGLIREGVEVRGGVATPLDVGIQSTGVCQPDREPQCDLSGSNFAPDSQQSGGQMWALAKVAIDPDADTWLLYVDLHGPRVTGASADSSISVGIEPLLNIVAVTYEKQPPPGTVLTLMVTADDGTTASFEFAVS
jgi:hypothetical protein